MNERLKELYAEQKQLHKVLNKVRLNEINREIYAINEQIKQQQKKQRQIDEDIKFDQQITKILTQRTRNNVGKT
jgi:hypothetical protein